MSPFTHRNIAIATSIAAALCLTVPVQAEVVSTEQTISASQAEQDRAKVRDFLDRATVRDKLQAMGVRGAIAQDRVAALTDKEAATLAQRIDALPAGGNLGNQDLIIILLIAILVALAV